MISILCPTRSRSGQLRKMVESARNTATKPIEIVVYVDEDDPKTMATVLDLDLKYMVGPRLWYMTEYWNVLVPLASGDILLQGNDDVIFRTKGWDVMVQDAFDACPDKILMVHGNDLGGNRESAGPHPFVSRKWVDTLGYFIAPYFSSDFGDTWINDIANALGRRKYIPFVMEHMHYIWGKADIDQTTKDRQERHTMDKPENVFDALQPIRELDTEKLRAVTKGVQPKDPKLSLMILTQPSRAAFLAKLLDRLKPQVAKYPDVVIDIRMFDGNLSLGANRERMRQASRGEYICFIDDDDLVPEDYLAKIYPLLDGVDQIGFRVQCYIDGEPLSKTFHSLKYKSWSADKDGHYRDISHINPMRRVLALQVSMDGGVGEDSRWSDAMRQLNIVKTEHYIDEVMYLYYYRNNKTDAYTPRQQQKKEGGHGFRHPVCPKCESDATCLAGGMRQCNQCGARWV